MANVRLKFSKYVDHFTAGEDLVLRRGLTSFLEVASLQVNTPGPAAGRLQIFRTFELKRVNRSRLDDEGSEIIAFWPAARLLLLFSRTKLSLGTGSV